MPHENVKVVTTKLPTYLETLLEEGLNVKLVYREKLTIIESSASLLLDNIRDYNETSELELTGTPLQIDLGGADDTVCSDPIIVKLSHWTAAEAQQYPLTLNEARLFINNELELNGSSASIYCICDGKDGENTVGLGVNVNPGKIIRILVFALPFSDECDEANYFEYVRKDHVKNVGKTTKVKVSSTKIFNLFGSNLKNFTPHTNVEHHGNITIEVSSIEASGGSQNNSDVKMNLQVIIGHRESPVISFWEELCLVQSYIRAAESKQINESTVLNSESNLDSMEIISVISDLVNTVSCFKKTNSELDLKDLRELDFLEKLWNILKNCGSLSDLRDCFLFFLEELAEKQTKIHSIHKYKSTVGEIVNGILDGRIAVPTLSFSQCLELLIELGLEKVKNDYVVVIGKFYSVAEDTILKKWIDLTCECSEVNANKMQRRTRISINPKCTIVDVASSKLKLSFLDSLHKISEFMFLCQDNLQSLQMSEECFDCFGEVLSKKFIVNFENIVRVCDFKQPRMCAFSFNISSADANVFIKKTDEPPVAMSIRMSSSVDLGEVITVFHFSEYPIFPPSIIADTHDPTCDTKEVKNLYVSKLVKYVHNC